MGEKESGMANMRGIAYGVGVGPGDPELMTLKAVRLIRENDVMALPGREPRETAAYKIAAAAVPEIADKALVPLCMPMINDRALLEEAHKSAARRIEEVLDRGKNVVYLALGDPTVYCTFSYIQRWLEADGYETRLVSGVPSFCAAAARLNVPLAEWDEPLHVIPSVHRPEEALDAPGSCVLMKPASQMPAVKRRLKNSGRKVMMVENCGMEGEMICRSVDEIPDDAGYLSLIIARQ